MSPRLSDLLLSSQSDERLVSLAQAGHERAFVVIVERYRPELQAMARRLCADGRAEDVVQQAFLSAFAALRSGSEVRHLRGWLYQIVRNAAGRLDTPPCVPLEHAEISAENLEDVVQQRTLALSALSEIARLPARQRQAMIGTALDGRGRAEIASSMGLSEGAVRQLVHRARITLRGAVTALTPWPLARWFAAVGPDAPGPAELAAGAGAASSGGLALKLGALFASGTLLTGAAVHLQSPAPRHSPGRVAAAPHVRARPAQMRAGVVAPVVTQPVVARTLLAGTGSNRPVAHRAPGGSGSPGAASRRARHETATGLSVSRGDGQTGGRHDGGTRSGRAGQRSGEGHRGDGQPAVSGFGSAGSGQGSAPSAGTHNDGTNDGGSRGPGTPLQMVSQSQQFGSDGGGSGSGHDVSSGDGSGSGSGSGGSSTSGTSSSSDGASVSSATQSSSDSSRSSGD